MDWAAWCHYKYVNAGPGGRVRSSRASGHDLSLPRLAGWWGNDPATRFRMDRTSCRAARGRMAGLDALGARVRTVARVARALRCRRQSALRERSVRVTGYLESLLDVVGRSAGCRSSRRASRRAAAASSRSPSPTRGRSRLRCGGVPRHLRRARARRDQARPGAALLQLPRLWRAAGALRELLPGAEP